jgi:putative flippase GtrA
MTLEHVVKGASINFAINAVINGVINWFQLDRSKNHFLTVDSITSSEHTVFSGAVVLAVSLAFILSSIAYFTVKDSSKPPYLPKVFLLALKHSVYAFGLVALAGMLLQRYAGSIEVSPIVAATIAGLIAGIVAGIVDYETKMQLFVRNK